MILYKIAHISSYIIIRYYRSQAHLCTKKYAYCFKIKKKKAKAETALISLEIVSFATSSYAEQKSHHPPACLRGSRLERERERKKERKKGDRLAWAILGCNSQYRRAVTSLARAQKRIMHIVLQVSLRAAIIGQRDTVPSRAGANEQSRAKALRAAGGLTLAFFAAIRVV